MFTACRSILTASKAHVDFIGKLVDDPQGGGYPHEDPRQQCFVAVGSLIVQVCTVSSQTRPGVRMGLRNGGGGDEVLPPLVLLPLFLLLLNYLYF